MENLPVVQFNLVGNEKNHLKVDFKLGDMWINSIGFKKAYLLDNVLGQDKINFAGHIEKKLL